MKTKNISFEKEILNSCKATNAISALFVYLYGIILCNMNIIGTLNIFCFLSLLVGFSQFVIAPFTNRIITHDVSKRISKWQTDGATLDERTDLLIDVQKIAQAKKAEVRIYFFVCAFIMCFAYQVLLHIDTSSVILSGLSCLFGSFIAGLLALIRTQRVCSKYSSQLVSQGVKDDVVMDKKVFGTSYYKSYLDYLAAPVMYTSLLFMCVFFIFQYSDLHNAANTTLGLTSVHFNTIFLVAIVNVVACMTLAMFFFLDIMKSSNHVQEAMLNIVNNDIYTVPLSSTDVSNEVTYNLYLINKIVIIFRSVLKKLSVTGKNMLKPSLELSEIAEETAATSLEQSSGVKEILATMEATDNQTREIADKISDVTKIAQDTSSNVESGFLTLQSNLDKMNEITQTNSLTINGIKDLGEKIGNIWGIVNIINDIAAQTRIIAFNAELEASGAGEAGKSFHIIANEIRRLASGITDSVEQIKERITEIQHMSDNLIITSESGTEKIREGRELTSKLEQKFSDIRNSSEITVESSEDIKNHIQQQSAAFDQIVSTIRQISAGIENFSASTGTVNQTASRLKDAADKLENLHAQLTKLEDIPQEKSNEEVQLEKDKMEKRLHEMEEQLKTMNITESEQV